MHTSRPSTSSGSGRPTTAAAIQRQLSGGAGGANNTAAATNGQFIIRIRSRKGTVRCVLPSSDSTVGSLRESIAAQTSVPIEAQRITKQRKPWFDSQVTAVDNSASDVDDFPDDSASLSSYGCNHGDMLFLEESEAFERARQEAEAMELIRAEESQEATHGLQATSSSWGMEAVEAASQLSREVSEGSQLSASPIPPIDEPSIQPTEAQKEAQRLLDAIKQHLPNASSSLQLQLAELERLFQSPAAAEWISSRPSTVNVPPLDSAAFTRPDSSLAVNSETDRSLRSRESQRDELESTSSRTSSRGAGSAGSFSSAALGDETNRTSSRAGSAGVVRGVSSSASTTDTETITNLTSEVTYWKGRYERLRVKAETMNQNGMSLKNRFDAMQFQHEKDIIVLKSRVKRREEKLAQLQRVLEAWENQDRARGGDGTVYVEPLPPQPSTLTSLAAAPSIRPSSHHQPVPPASNEGDHHLQQPPSSSPSGTPSSGTRRVRPESASRFRSRVVVSHSSDPNTSMGAQPTPPSPVQRPSSSSGRSARPPVPTEEDDSNNAAMPAHALADLRLDADDEGKRFRQAQADASIAASRAQVRQAIDSSRQGRGGLGSRSSGPVAATRY